MSQKTSRSAPLYIQAFRDKLSTDALHEAAIVIVLVHS